MADNIRNKTEALWVLPKEKSYKDLFIIHAYGEIYNPAIKLVRLMMKLDHVFIYFA